MTFNTFEKIKTYVDVNYSDIVEFYNAGNYDDLKKFLKKENKILIFQSIRDYFPIDDLELYLRDAQDFYIQNKRKNKFYVFLDINENIPDRLKKQYSDVFQCIDSKFGHAHYVPYFAKDTEVKEKNFRYHFLSLNNRSTFTRLNLFLFFYRHKLLSKSNFSYIGATRTDQSSFDDLINRGADFYLNEFLLSDQSNKIDPAEVKNIIPYRLSEIDYENELESMPSGFFKNSELIDVFGRDWTKTNSNKMYKSSIIQIVTETFDNDSQGTFLTEKIWKPIIGFQPFLLLGGGGSLAKLKEIGFQTFSDVFDESYDEMNLPKRFEHVFKEIKRLAEYSLDDLAKLYQKILPTLEHNYNFFYNEFLPKYQNEERDLQIQLEHIIQQESTNLIDAEH